MGGSFFIFQKKGCNKMYERAQAAENIYCIESSSGWGCSFPGGEDRQHYVRAKTGAAASPNDLIIYHDNTLLRWLTKINRRTIMDNKG
jgi:hypothetical protein